MAEASGLARRRARPATTVQALKAWGSSDPVPPDSEVEMPVSAVSRYRGGTVADVTRLARTMKAVLLKHGVAYRIGRFETGQNVGEWMVVVQYADWMAYARAKDGFAQDPDHRKAVAEISKVVTLLSRELVVDLDL